MTIQESIKNGATISPGGNSKDNKTGSWRQGQRPKWNKEKYLNCGVCFHFCPEEAIIFKDGKMVGIDYTYCKGCGICAHECPRKAIEMVKED